MDHYGAKMAAEFEFYKVKPGEYRYRLIGGNGDVILSSDVYTSKLGCTKAIESVKNNASNPDNYVREPTPNGTHQFNLISLNGRVIGMSQEYETIAEYDRGILNVSRQARSAIVNDKC